MQVESVNKRYLFKFISTLSSMFSGILSHAFISRAIGPAGLGNYNFLVGFFDQILAMLDFGIIRYVYNKVSQKQDAARWTDFYFRFMALVGLTVLLGVCGVWLLGVREMVWPGQQGVFILAAFFMSYILWSMQVVGQFADAHGLTVQTERLRWFQGIGSAGIFVLFYFMSALNLTTYFLLNYAIFGLLVVGWVIIIRKNGIILLQRSGVDLKKMALQFRETWDYVKPMVVYGLVGTLCALIDRWMLQYFGGSSQQGYFAFAYRIQQFCVLFVSAFVPIATREFAIALGQNDNRRIANIYASSIPVFMAVSGYIAYFVVTQSDGLVRVLGGDQFDTSSVVAKVMMFQVIYYPISLISTSVFMATGRTVLYSRVGMLTMLLGVPVLYFMVAPGSSYGLGLGAAGLSIKNISVDIITTNTFLWWICRTYNISFWSIFRLQIIFPLVFIPLAKSSALLAGLFFANSTANFILSGMIYTLGVAVMIRVAPRGFGLPPDFMSRYITTPLGNYWASMRSAK